MRWFIVLVMLAGTSAFGQVSTDEAQKRLQERSATRQAERSKVVSISQGELDDLRAQINILRAQLAADEKEITRLKAKAVVPTSQPVIAALPVASAGLSIGMTVDEANQVMASRKFPRKPYLYEETAAGTTIRWTSKDGFMTFGQFVNGKLVRYWGE